VQASSMTIEFEDIYLGITRFPQKVTFNFLIWNCLEEPICFLTATCVYLFSALTRNNQCER